ncbi:MAG TPA: NAD(P)/FAD-dependent oxidoreductase [Propionibacteriaceae bacterium]|nr:NAD(P)/FAD-dependent oxidoreductase [Propionibacteriaceae bacterium]
MILLRCDVVVVGAGPAGSMAALSAARAGAEVILLDRRQAVGLPVQCAEYVPWQLAEHVPWSPDCVVQRISAMRTHLPDGQVVETSGRGYMIDRWRLDQHLAEAARHAGACLLLRTRAVEPAPGGLLARQHDREARIQARVIVAADGPRSTVGSWIGSDHRGLLTAAQCTVALDGPLATTQVYFDPAYEGGYGWLFPKGKVANVGVGLKHGLRAKDALRHLLDRLSITRDRVLSYTGGLIPSGGPLERTWQDNVILVGDAAGQTHPITGAGVANACLCGSLAGQVAGRAAVKNDPTLLEGYERQWRDFLGAVLAHATARRRFLDAHWSHDRHQLSTAVRQSWIAFPDYGKHLRSSNVLTPQAPVE